MMGDKPGTTENSCVFKILGDDYIIKGRDSIEYMHQIVSYIENTIQCINEVNPRLNKSQVLLFSALKIADELHKLRREYSALEELLEEAK